jgi:hypothetical protein
MAAQITFPMFATNILVNTRTQPKIVLLPAASTIAAGRFLYIKDICGNAGVSSIFISTVGRDSFDGRHFTSTSCGLMSTNFQSLLLASDGLLNWMILQNYNSNLVSGTVPNLSLIPPVRYSFLSTNYSGSGNVNNIGSNSAIGSATVSLQSYTSANPGYMTSANQVSHYVQAPSQTGIQTIIMIVRVTNAGGNTYLLDARDGLANGWMWSGATGPDWTGQTYYRDTVLTTVPTNVPGSLQDSTWHHVCFIRPAFTDNVTYLARISQNESVGADCAEIMSFTQALTQQQVKDNFNFFAPRFGWTPVA